MDRWFQLYLSNFDAGVNNVMIPDLTEPDPYMRQVLSPMGAHSVSGGALLNITGCHPESLWRLETTFHSPPSSTIYKMIHTVSVTDFLSYLCALAYFKGLILRKQSGKP